MQFLVLTYTDWCYLDMYSVMNPGCQWYHPSPKAFRQQLRICSSMPLLWYSRHAGESTKPYQCRLDGLGRTSYTERIRKLMRSGLELHSSAQVILRCSAFSYLVQAPCWCIPTILVRRSSRPAPTDASPSLLFVIVMLWKTAQACPSHCHVANQDVNPQPCLCSVHCFLCLPLPSRPNALSS